MLIESIAIAFQQLKYATGIFGGSISHVNIIHQESLGIIRECSMCIDVSFLNEEGNAVSNSLP